MKKWIGLLVLISPALVFSETVEKIVAVVNDEIILLSDLRREEVFWGETLPWEQQIQTQVEHRLLLYEAKRFVVKPPLEKDVDQALETLLRRFKNKTDFQKRLQEMGMDIAELRVFLADHLWVATFLEDRIGFFIFVRDEEVDQYAKEHPDVFAAVEPHERKEQIRRLLKLESKKIKTRDYIAQLLSRAKVQIYGPSPNLRGWREEVKP